MSQDFKLSSKQMDALLKLAGKKMGIDPKKLKKQMESGQMDDVVKNLNTTQQAQIKNLMNNPAAVQKLMENEKLQALIKDLTGK